MKPTYIITLPSGRTCSVGVYVDAWKQIRKMAPNKQVAGFGHFAEDAGKILGEMRYGLHDRINRHIPRYGRGRKWDPDYQRHLWQDAWEANTPRLMVWRFRTKELNKRLAHRLTPRGDY